MASEWLRTLRKPSDGFGSPAEPVLMAPAWHAQARPDLNGETGVALRYQESSGRWLVRLKGGEGKQLKPANLEVVGDGTSVVHCVWGDAQWSRTQLLGEIGTPP